ncbi:hypothetical protein BSKO_04770 [Bryopsis sp. KO-2023]|nr:hypothetical protein BSKO_04770 [Bryopsis sp. KO-2023]
MRVRCSHPSFTGVHVFQKARPTARNPEHRASVSRFPLNCVKSQAGPQLFGDANFPTDAEGRTYHVGTKKGEVANRVLTVGCHKRAAALAEFLEPLDNDEEVFCYESKRRFVTFTGMFRGTPVSIVATMMGMPNMDFVVRETRAVVEGPMAILRLGSCGGIQPPARLGNLAVASKGSICIRRNPDAFSNSNGSCPPYTLCHPALPDERLTKLLIEEGQRQFGEDAVVECLNASADSFYSSQGRVGVAFHDKNESLIEHVVEEYPDAVSLEMETFQLLDLARCSQGSIAAAGACLVLAERYTNAFLDLQGLHDLESKAGMACLMALCRY